jgi:TldD protein
MLGCAGFAGHSVPFAGAGDPVLEAMQAEMQRSIAQLALPGVRRPYYIEYRVEDIEQYQGEAVFGALSTDLRSRSRLARVVVRLGDYKQDSFFGDATSALEAAPLDNDVTVMRHQLWSATDRAFKAAVEALNRKQALRKRFPEAAAVDDFSHEAPVQSLGALQRLQFDRARWAEVLRRASGLYRSDAGIENLQAGLSARAVNRYLLNSEGTVARSGSAVYMFTVAGVTQAADGMHLARSPAHTAAEAAELPSPAEAQQEAAKVVETLRQLREAPLVEDEYHGPVLMSGDSTNTLFNRVAAQLEAGRSPTMANTARSQGAYGSSYKSRILPEFLTLVDDPTQTSFEGKRLVGSYAVDDEGVKAQPLTLVEKGVLVNYLEGRQPVRDFPRSNGHGRAALSRDPAPHYANLFVRSSAGVSREELEKKLIEICKDRGLAYGYYVETMAPDLSPRLLYRVYVDGHRQLVRGASFEQLDARALRSDVVAAGNDAYLDQRMDPVPASLVTPSLLFEEMTVKRATRPEEKLPDYPPPALRGR